MLIPGTPIEPLILRAKAGECIHVELTNGLDDDLADPHHYSQVPMVIENFNTNEIQVSSHVGLHPQRVTYDTMEDEGANVGFNVMYAGTGTAKPGQTVEYKWYAGDVRIERSGRKFKKVATPIEFGSINLVPSDPIEHSAKGLIAGLIIEPEYSIWTVDPHTRAQATVTKYDANGGEVETFREFVVMFQDDIQLRDASASRSARPSVQYVRRGAPLYFHVKGLKMPRTLETRRSTTAPSRCGSETGTIPARIYSSLMKENTKISFTTRR